MPMVGAQMSGMNWTGILYAKKLENARLPSGRRMQIAGVDNFQTRAPAQGTSLAGSFRNGALLVSVDNRGAGAAMLFTESALNNTIERNPGGAVESLARAGARFAFTDSERTGAVLKELGVNALQDRIEIQRSRLAGGAREAAARPADMSALATAPKKPDMLLPLMDGTEPGGDAPEQNAPAGPGNGTTHFADAAKQTGADAAPISDADLIQALGGLIAMASMFNASGMNRAAPAQESGADKEYEGSAGYSVDARVEATLYQNGAVTVEAEASVELGATAQANATYSEGSFDASVQGFAGVRAEASLTAEARISDDVTVTSTTTASAQAGVSGEGRASGTVREDEVSAAAYGGFSAGAETGVAQTNTVAAGDSSLTTTAGVSAGLSVGASGGGEFAVTDQSVTLGFTMDLDLGIGVTLGFETTVDYDDVTQGLENGYGVITDTGAGFIGWANAGLGALTSSDKDDGKHWWQR
jgi:hypothetical protein